MTIKKNGNGTYTVSKWYWLIRSICVPIIVAIFFFGSAWALIQFKVEQNRANIMDIQRDVNSIKCSITGMEKDLIWIKKTLGFKE